MAFETNPVKCECGFWDRDRPHSRVGGGVCKYAFDRRQGRVDHTGDIAIPDEVVDLKLLLDCRRVRDDMFRKYDALMQDLRIRQDQLEKLEEENKRLAKCCTQRGARMQIMWKWMRETRPSESYDRVADQFLWDMSDGTYASWFDENGVPVWPDMGEP